MVIQRSIVVLLCCSFIIPIVVIASDNEDFQESRFRMSVSKALQTIANILDTSRNPRLAGASENDGHTYDDKYALAEMLTNTAIASQWNVLSQFGFTSKMLQKPQLNNSKMGKSADTNASHSSTKVPVVARFVAEDYCVFLKEEEVELPSSNNTVVEYEISETKEEAGWTNTWKETTNTKTVKTKVIRKKKEYHWTVGWSYKLMLFQNDDMSAAMDIFSRNASTTIITSTSSYTGSISDDVPPTPLPAKTLHKPIDINLTWLFAMISYDQNNDENDNDPSCHFAIDRFSDKAKNTCKTPRRNTDIEKAMEFNRQLFAWALQIKSFFFDRGLIIQKGHQPVTQPTSQQQNDPFLQPVFEEAKNLFIPIAPLMEDGQLLSNTDIEALLKYQTYTITEAIEKKLPKLFPAASSSAQQNHTTNQLLSIKEASIVLLCEYLMLHTTQYQDSLNYVEYLLQRQLVQAIGKYITPQDFDDFMHFHNQKLFKDPYAPELFIYAVRRPDHFPEGTISIEKVSNGGGISEPIETFARKISSDDGDEANNGDHPSSSSIMIPINAATSVKIKGDRYLHGWIQHLWQHGEEHDFYPSPSNQQYHYQLVARAHQFSSYLVILGTMAGSNKFQPKDAIIVQNKDEVFIRLLTNVIPSAKQFQDAIFSLSPEQKAFAQAFRGMQLESSVFGVCVIQLKPQLEKLLGLPYGALTKEIQLTQDLMSLFVDYQIPSDLLTFDGAPEIPVSDKVEAVKNYVNAVMDVIDKAKEKQYQEEDRMADLLKKQRKYDFQYSDEEEAIERQAISFEWGGSIPTASPSSSAPITKPSGSHSSSARRTKVRSMPVSSPSNEQSESVDNSSNDGKTSEQMLSSTTSASSSSASSSSASSSSSLAEKGTGKDDFTLLPKILDRKLEKYDTDGSLRSTIIKADSNNWRRTRQENLFRPSQTDYLSGTKIESEKKKAFDLLVALSRSGNLPIDCAELHVVIAVSHCFSSNIMSTIIQDNINPIEKVENSMLMIASTIFSGGGVEEERIAEPERLIADNPTLERLKGAFPALLDNTTTTSNDNNNNTSPAINTDQ